MAFDPAKVPGGDVAAWGAHCRAKALDGLESEDWKIVYDWTKSWVGWGGGAWIPDTWLLYAVSGLLHGQPRSAVHSLDLGIGIWLTGPIDRGLLIWCRGVVVMRYLTDPKTALLDLRSVEEPATWLASTMEGAVGRGEQAAAHSRRRKPTVPPRPEFTGADSVVAAAAPPVGSRRDGDRPAVWDHVAAYLSA
jgi:hypothetical protein